MARNRQTILIYRTVEIELEVLVERDDDNAVTAEIQRAIYHAGANRLHANKEIPRELIAALPTAEIEQDAVNSADFLPDGPEADEREHLSDPSDREGW